MLRGPHGRLGLFLGRAAGAIASCCGVNCRAVTGRWRNQGDLVICKGLTNGYPVKPFFTLGRYNSYRADPLHQVWHSPSKGETVRLGARALGWQKPTTPIVSVPGDGLLLLHLRRCGGTAYCCESRVLWLQPVMCCAGFCWGLRCGQDALRRLGGGCYSDFLTAELRCGDGLTSSPPAEKATTSENQAGKSSADDGAGNGGRGKDGEIDGGRDQMSSGNHNIGSCPANSAHLWEEDETGGQNAERSSDKVVKDGGNVPVGPSNKKLTHIRCHPRREQRTTWSPSNIKLFGR